MGGLPRNQHTVQRNCFRFACETTALPTAAVPANSGRLIVNPIVKSVGPASPKQAKADPHQRNVEALGGLAAMAVGDEQVAAGGKVL